MLHSVPDLDERRRSSLVIPSSARSWAFALALLGAATLRVEYSGAQSIRSDLYGSDGMVFAIAVSGDTLYMGGSFSNLQPPATGGWVQIDPTTGGVLAGYPAVAGPVSCAVQDGSGGWFIGGGFSAVGGVPRAGLAHIASDNTVTSWNPGVVGIVQGITLSGSTVYMYGQFSSIGGQPRTNLAAVDAVTGQATSWDPFPTFFNLYGGTILYSLAASGSTVYVGGEFTVVGGKSRFCLVALDGSTGEPTDWNPNPDNVVSSVIADGSRVYVSGSFSQIAGGSHNHFAVLDAASGLLLWDPGADGGISSVVPEGSTVYMAGGFHNIGGQARSYLAALDASTGLATAWNPNVPGVIVVLAPNGSKLEGLGVTDYGTQLTPLSTIDIPTAHAATVQVETNTYGPSVLEGAGSAVCVGGFFNSVGPEVPRNNIAAVDLTTGQPLAWNPGADNTVSALLLRGSTLYVGGLFTQIGGQARTGLAAFDTGTGQPLAAFNPSASWPYGNAWFNALALSGPTLYVGGVFTQINGQSRNAIAALDPTTGQPTSWNPGSSYNYGGPNVFALAVNNGIVYAGGNFNSMGGQPRNYLAAVSAGNGQATSWNPNPGGPSTEHVVNAITTDGSNVYVGGNFTSIGGQARNNLAAIDWVSGHATSWNPDANSGVDALAVQGSDIIVGGSFTGIGGAGQSAFAALDKSTGAAESWNPNSFPTGPSEMFALSVDGGTIYGGGSFQTFGTSPVNNLMGVTSALAGVAPRSGPELTTLIQQIVPNPFRGSTHIRFSLASPADVTVAIQDLAGRRVATVVDHESYSAGAHEVEFRSPRLAAGLYWCELATGRTTEAKPMVVIH